jgi:hypothetical protein
MYIFRAKDEIDGNREEADETNENGKLDIALEISYQFVSFLTVLTKYEKLKYI